ncbi:DegT/DnrJ/EryC1/StrS family aminotransferase [Candidatus Parcubacteria bacterium]|nr:MAG: DegT/DnrJ/EryC1/StrS family aminotransferase [Candidatus Parcubacteria bacterium]
MNKNIPLFKVFIPPKHVLLPALEEVLYSGKISEGEPVVRFEGKFVEHFNLKNALSLYSGTAALHTALIISGVGPGDEVISTPMTAEPSNMAIKHAGARIIWADVDPLNGNLTAESIAERITHKTKAIMVVHYGGVPAPILDIQKIALKCNIPVIEDAAHALGARYDGQYIGNHSDHVVFSFQAIKHMTTIDGGMLICRNREDFQKGKLLRWFGIDRNAIRTEIDIKTIGYKYHMNNVNATIGLIQLSYIDGIIKKYVSNGKYFDLHLKNVDGIETCKWDKIAEPSYWFYTVLVEKKEDFIRHLKSYNIDASSVHRRNDKHSVFKDSRSKLPGLDQFYQKMVHIPCGWWVSETDREYMIHTIKKGW